MPKFDVNLDNKYEKCIESKFARKIFKFVQDRSKELVHLIHSDLCDFKTTPTHGGKIILLHS